MLCALIKSLTSIKLTKVLFRCDICLPIPIYNWLFIYNSKTVLTCHTKEPLCKSKTTMTGWYPQDTHEYVYRWSVSAS